LGLKCELVLPHISRYDSATYASNGNLLLDRLFGAALHIIPGDDTARTTAAPVIEQVLEHVRARGDVPYFIPPGGSSPIGALGYVDAAFELARQAKERTLQVDHVVVTTGSTTTHAGLVVGFECVRQAGQLDCNPTIHGISVYQRREPALATVREKVHATAELLGFDGSTLDERVRVTDEYLGGGYGEPTGGMLEAVTLAARCEGLLVDPVYTGKTLAGLIDMVRQGRFAKTDNVVFFHTGGTPALFAYREAFDEVLSPAAEASR
jgi:1-aminocyclopropane-1-carboxylate deaminase/D-cysteine desulfhydrase-like pyridoxal-dependent ACC family enzyme